MIDFVSTREGMDVQSARCARLLAAVIAHAIRDAAQKPNDSEKQARGNSGHAYRAIRFLFEPGTAFEVYAQLIGTSAEEIRRNLLGNDRLLPHSSFKAEDRRNIKIRYNWYINNPDFVQEEQEDDYEQTDC